MEFIKTAALRGSNRWAADSVLEAHVDGRLHRPAWHQRESEFRTTIAQGLRTVESVLKQTTQASRLTNERALELVQQLTRRMEHELSLIGALDAVARAFQAAAGVPSHFSCIEETDESGVEILVLGYEEEALVRGCLDTARTYLNAVLADESFDIPGNLRRLAELADDVRLGPSSRAIVRAATARGIPYRRLGAGSLVQLGEGCLHRRIWTAETDATSAIAESIAQDKDLTKRLLRAVGVPVPLGRPVISPEDAWDAALEIGLPVVVKPRKANHARGITLDLTTREQVMAAYDWAVTDGENTGVLVEQYARGHAHRLLVVGHRLIAAARGESEYVWGDGVRTIRALVDEVNLDPRRGENYTDLLNPVRLDDAALIELRKQGFTPDSIPAPGQRVLVQHVGDLTTDCTADVHPDNAAKAVLAARVVGLDIAGLDVVAEDIRRPLAEQRGAILEVNAGPSLSMHVTPLHGEPQPVGEAIVDMLFAPGLTGRIPLIAVGGDGPRTQVAARLDQLLRVKRWRIGRSTADGVFLAGARFGAPYTRDTAGFESLLIHPDVDAVIIESQPEQAAAYGIGTTRLDLAIICGLSTTEDSSNGGPDGRATSRYAALAALRSVGPDGAVVLPLDSWDDVELRHATRGKLVYFAAQPDPQRGPAALAAGARLLMIRGHDIVLARSEGEESLPLPPTRALDASTRAVELAALAGAWAVGLVADELREAR